MAVRKSIIIGCGTTGSEIAAKVFINFKQYIRRTGENENDVQFILIDTQDPIRGAEELHRRGDHKMIGIRQAQRTFEYVKQNDPFFNTWWVEKYTNIPTLFPGCGTVPINGRLCFWEKLGNPAGQDSFQLKFLNAAHFGTKNQIEAAAGKILVFIIGTLSGGTGAGIFLDIAQQIKHMNDIDVDIEIHGVFLLPDIVNMRAEPAFHDQTCANAYGAFTALNYWQTPIVDRPIDIGPFMQKHGREITGANPPFTVCWLISRLNANSHGLPTIYDYMQMSADAISMMIFEENAGNLQARFNDLISKSTDIFINSYNPQPKPYASFGTYTLCFNPQKAITYLTNDMMTKTLDAFEAAPADITEHVKTQAVNYMVQNKLREVDEKDDGSKFNEVTEALRSLQNEEGFILYPVMQTILQHLGRSDDATALISTLTNSTTQAGNLAQVFNQFKDNVTAGLTGVLQRQDGVNYQELIRSNRKNLLNAAVRSTKERDQGKDDQSTGLHQLVTWLLKEDEYPLASTKRVLELIKSDLPRHRLSLEYELKGDKKKGYEGDLDRIKRLEDNLGQPLNVLSEKLFKGPKGKRKEAARQFEEAWWKPWLATKISIMAKTEAIAFYKELENEIDWLHDFLTTDLENGLRDSKSKADEMKASLYGQGIHGDVARLGEEAILDGTWLERKYYQTLLNSIEPAKGIITVVIVEKLGELIGKEKPTMDARRSCISELEKSLNSKLSEEGQARFTGPMSELSLWESMTLGQANPTPDQMKAVIESRINSMNQRCVPYWTLTPGFENTENVTPVVLWSYDKETKYMFENANKLEISIPEPVGGTAEVNEALGVAKSAYQISNNELKVLNCAGGIPLNLVTPVNNLQDEFERRWEKARLPSITDQRYERLIKRGTVPWKIIPIDMPVDVENTCYLLMAEHLRILESPMPKSPNGKYKYKDQLLYNQRFSAFRQLLSGGEYNKLMKDIKDNVDTKVKDFTEIGWETEHLKCFMEIVQYLNNAPKSAAKKYVQEQLDMFMRYLKDKWGYEKRDDIEKAVLDRLGVDLINAKGAGNG